MAKKKSSLDFLAFAIATSGGVGLIPKAPGTAGSLVGVAVFVGLGAAGLSAYFLHAIILALVAGIWASGRVERLHGKDSQNIVIDEVVGQMIALAALTEGDQGTTARLVAGFLLFRAFDIGKPFPIRHLEKLPGGLGVMADDVGAGLLAMTVLLWF